MAENFLNIPVFIVMLVKRFAIFVHLLHFCISSLVMMILINIIIFYCDDDDDDDDTPCLLNKWSSGLKYTLFED